MTISRAQLDQRVLAGLEQQDNQVEVANTESTDGSFNQLLAPPFDEPIYTVNEAAKILRLSPNQARAIFRNEPGVHDLSADSARSRFLKRRSQLRIPHGVLVRFWKRTETERTENITFVNKKRQRKPAA